MEVPHDRHKRIGLDPSLLAILTLHNQVPKNKTQQRIKRETSQDELWKAVLSGKDDEFCKGKKHLCRHS